MHRGLEARLKLDFPELFREPRVRCYVGNGWEPLLRRLCVALATPGLGPAPNNPQHDLTFVQIKQKFGYLRAYIAGDGYGRHLRMRAGQESLLICETCGEDGKLGILDGWISVACQECADGTVANGREARWIEVHDGDSD
uniref:Uncharacterized protein n=1 Tax=Mycena chlorophos TaxID=658473 RepID=A0ABQ0KWT1_MYCCL|nr:predicted protein [Mycena chlorophos]